MFDGFGSFYQQKKKSDVLRGIFGSKTKNSRHYSTKTGEERSDLYYFIAHLCFNYTGYPLLKTFAEKIELI